MEDVGDFWSMAVRNTIEILPLLLDFQFKLNFFRFRSWQVNEIPVKAKIYWDKFLYMAAAINTLLSESE